MGRVIFVLSVMLGLVMTAGVAAAAGDLEMNDIGFSPVESTGVYEGQTLRIFVNVTNNGPEVNSSDIEYYMNAQLLSISNTGSMEPEEVRQYFYDYHTQKGDAGTRNMNAKLTIEDDNTDNNDADDDYYIRSARADLTVEKIEFDRALIIDNYVTLTATINNENGTEDANNVDIRLEEDGEGFTTGTVSSIPAGTIQTIGFSFRLTDTGTFDYTVEADYTTEIDEMDEVNNEFTKSFDVTNPTGTDKPDFDPEVPVWPANYAQGQTIDVTVIVWNNGTYGWSNSTIPVALLIDGEEVDRVSASMAANHFDEVELTWRITSDPGEYHLNVSVDPNGTATEEHEDNNVASLEITVEPPYPKDHPDLAVSVDEIDFSVGGHMVNGSGSVIEETDVDIRVTITNLGNMSAEDVPIMFYVDGEVLVNTTFDIKGEWDPPVTKIVQTLWESVLGNHTIGIWIDRYMSGDVNETDGEGNLRRENNYAERDIRVVEGPLPDFYIDPSAIELTADDDPITEVEENTTVRLEFDIANVGEVSGMTMITVFDSSVPAPQNVIGAVVKKFTKELDVNQTETLTVSWDINGTGVHYIRLIALNASGDDSDFSNNEGQVSVDVTGVPLPDLIITEITLSETSPLRNGSVQITFSIKNNGTDKVDDNFLIEISIIGDTETLLGSVEYIHDIPLNTTVISDYTWDLNYFGTGVYKIRVNLDPISSGEPGHGKVVEYNEGNNDVLVNITVRAVLAPDVGLKPETIDLSLAWDRDEGRYVENEMPVLSVDYAIISGQELTVNIRVHNEGNQAMDHLRVNLTLQSLEAEPTSVIETKVIANGSALDPAIAVGDTRDTSFTIDVSTITEIEIWQLKISVETTAQSSTKEKSANLPNNYFETDIYMIPNLPDPAMLSMVLDPLEPTMLEEVTFTVEVANLGPSVATGNLKLIVDDNAVNINTNASAEDGTKIPVSLAAGENRVINFTYEFGSEKLYTLRARFDTSGDQIDGSNDHIEFGLYVRALSGVEFEIRSVDLPNATEEGKALTISVVIFNGGSSPATDVTIRFFDGTTVFSEKVFSIGSLDTATVDAIWNPKSPGRYFINVTINPGQTVVESDYTNNYYEQMIEVVDAEPDDKEKTEDVPIFIIVGVVGASIAAGFGIFFLLRR